MWLLQRFMKSLTKAAFALRVGPKEINNLEKEEKLTTYCRVKNHPLGIQATDNVIAEAEPRITS